MSTAATSCAVCGVGTFCPCGRCHGARWVYVNPASARATIPDPDLTKIAPEHQAEAVALVERRRTLAENTTYPCKECNTTAFYRWAGGHLNPNHDTAACDECAEHPMQRHRAAQPAAPPPRKDLI